LCNALYIYGKTLAAFDDHLIITDVFMIYGFKVTEEAVEVAVAVAIIGEVDEDRFRELKADPVDEGSGFAKISGHTKPSGSDIMDVLVEDRETFGSGQGEGILGRVEGVDNFVEMSATLTTGHNYNRLAIYLVEPGDSVSQGIEVAALFPEAIVGRGTENIPSEFVELDLCGAPLLGEFFGLVGNVEVG
jgi:hypothetical protein